MARTKFDRPGHLHSGKPFTQPRNWKEVAVDARVAVKWFNEEFRYGRVDTIGDNSASIRLDGDRGRITVENLEQFQVLEVKEETNAQRYIR